MQVISIILAIIGLLAATAIYGCCEEKVRESRGEEFLEFYHEEMQRITLPDDADIGLHVPGDLLRYSEEYLPLLHSKWEQILGEYAAVSRNVALMELKRKRLAQLNELSKKKIDCSHSVFFSQWNGEQQARLSALKKTHGEILSAVEKYYAEAQLRNLDSDADVTQQISGLIRGANAVLRQSGAPEEALSEEAPVEKALHAEPKEKLVSLPDSATENGSEQTSEQSETPSRLRSGTVYVPEISFRPDAAFAEGLDWQYGRNGRRKNMQKAAACYKRAAEAGHAAAQNNLGHLYHQGWGVNKDLSRAAHWYKRSAEQGHAFGQSNYGTCLEFGWGVRANKTEAIEWYRKAARQGHSSAQKHLQRLQVAP